MPERRRRGARRAAAGKRKVRALLAVDVGNSDTVVGLFRGARLTGFWRLTSGRLTADEVRLQVEVLARGAVDGGRPDAAVLCSVVPALTLAWAEALASWTGRPAVEVNPETARSLPIRYHDPAVVGADRIANAIAARDLYGTPAIVVDLGTATTFDCVSKAGEYLGGAIAPGVGLSAEALFQRAARLPRVELRRPTRALGRNTEESLQAGVLWGAAGLVDGLVRRLAREMKGRPQVIATGGWAKTVGPLCATVKKVDETLTLQGMRILWEEQG
jgi:type III pantothenate kinase